jgi:hypothetical protein
VRDLGLYDDIPEVEYHADLNSLSVSGAKTLLKAPALFRWEQDHPVYKDVFDFGSAAHRVALGAGVDVAIIPPTSRARVDQVAHREAKEAARAEGKTPITEEDHETVLAMAEVLRNHDDAAGLLTDGKPEVSAYWLDGPTGVTRRCRFDWLPNVAPDQRLAIGDYKTTRCAHRDAWAKDAADFGYEMQFAWYVDAAIALGLDDDPTFAFIVQEKTAPYLVAVHRLDADALQIGRWRNRKALNLYAECVKNDQWPGYENDLDLALPAYHLIKNSEAFA